jgi:hypothetical protein
MRRTNGPQVQVILHTNILVDSYLCGSLHPSVNAHTCGNNSSFEASNRHSHTNRLKHFHYPSNDRYSISKRRATTEQTCQKESNTRDFRNEASDLLGSVNDLLAIPRIRRDVNYIYHSLDMGLDVPIRIIPPRIQGLWTHVLHKVALFHVSDYNKTGSVSYCKIAHKILFIRCGWGHTYSSRSYP